MQPTKPADRSRNTASEGSAELAQPIASPLAAKLESSAAQMPMAHSARVLRHREKLFASSLCAATRSNQVSTSGWRHAPIHCASRRVLPRAREPTACTRAAIPPRPPLASPQRGGRSSSGSSRAAEELPRAPLVSPPLEAGGAVAGADTGRRRIRFSILANR
eukprot:scaffold7215_cov366-Prasinococcus_capsulatus_cf.AAC.10